MPVDNPDERTEVLIEALPFIRKFHGEKIVIKYGGSIMADSTLNEQVAEDIVLLQYVGIKPLVIHGGGPEIGDTMEQLGMKSEFVDGLRVTDEQTMDVVEMVLAGRVNKNIVNNINQAGANAIGLSGKDGRMFTSRSHSSKNALDVDIGQVGEIESVDPTPIELLEEKNYVPVIAPIGVDSDGVTHNMNADQVAGVLASALGARKLIFMTDVDGIMDDSNSRISTLKAGRIQTLLDNETVSGGMIPKIQSAYRAVTENVNKAHIINGTRPHTLLLELLTKEGIGTQILSDEGSVND